jgi:hypothetical protein
MTVGIWLAYVVAVWSLFALGGLVPLSLCSCATAGWFGDPR